MGGEDTEDRAGRRGTYTAILTCWGGGRSYRWKEGLTVGKRTGAGGAKVDEMVWEGRRELVVLFQEWYVNYGKDRDRKVIHDLDTDKEKRGNSE